MRKNVGGGRPDEIEFEYTPSGGAYGVSKFEFINSKVYVPAYDDTLSFNGVYELSMEIYNLRKRIEGFENLFRLVTREE